MSSLGQQTSNSGEDPRKRKRKRMISNRNSARRSRAKKKQCLDDLIKQIALLQDENGKIALKVDLYSEQYGKVDAENTILRTKLMELTERLHSLNSVLQFVEEYSGMTMDIPEIPDLLLEPWQLPCPAPQIAASARMFRF